jgi:hypothetical protein
LAFNSRRSRRSRHHKPAERVGKRQGGEAALRQALVQAQLLLDHKDERIRQKELLWWIPTRLPAPWDH